VVYLSSVAGGVFAVGFLLGALVRLPLMGINQFIPPVAAALHHENHRESLRRLYHVTSRLVLVGVTGLAVPVVVYREAVMALFGPTFTEYAPLLPGFITAQYAACAAGSVGILLKMTDNQRALLVVNVVITAFLAVTAVPLTTEFGLPGLVASYVLMLTVNNALEVAVLYYLEGLQPFTRLHAKPLLAAVPLAAVTLAAKLAVPGPAGPFVGTATGLSPTRRRSDCSDLPRSNVGWRRRWSAATERRFRVTGRFRACNRAFTRPVFAPRAPGGTSRCRSPCRWPARSRGRAVA
jgi:O-antigen/teichoic acid export membrane protein